MKKNTFLAVLLMLGLMITVEGADNYVPQSYKDSYYNAGYYQKALYTPS